VLGPADYRSEAQRCAVAAAAASEVVARLARASNVQALSDNVLTRARVGCHGRKRLRGFPVRS
jgi:hypothetical protein